MRKPLLFLIPLILTALGVVPTPGEAQGDHSITLDGRLTVEEWQVGADQPVSDEGWARLSRRDDGLYLAVRSNFVGMVDVMVQRGDVLHQLHVSGQVGGALFERGDDDLWRLERAYPWIGKVESREAFEAKKNERISALRQRIAKRPKPATAAEPSKIPPPPQTPKSLPAPAAPPRPPSPPPMPTAATVSSPTENAEIIAQHLEEHGWTGTIFNMGDSKTAEIFLSSAFLKPGDRLLVMWQRRLADRSFATEIFPADAMPMPEGVSAVYSTTPFAHDFANWHLVE